MVKFKPVNFTRAYLAWIGALICVVLVTPAARAAVTHEIVVSFATPPLQPGYGQLVFAADGYYWGTTMSGGAYDAGTIYKVKSDGSDWTLVVSFSRNGGSNRGAKPSGGLTLGNDGNFYGTTQNGGAGDKGTIFCITPAGVLTTLVDFTGNGPSNRGAYPSAALVKAADGNFFGTTQVGGTAGGGTVFKVTPAGVLTTLVDFTFNGPVNRGATPFAPMILGSDGNFYGTTAEGGASGGGTIFLMSPDGALTTLVDFTYNGATNRGAAPHGPLLLDGTNFFGTTSAGGSGGFGTVFRLATGGGLTTLTDFSGNGPGSRGASPDAGLILGGDGNYYGTTRFGGNNDRGTVFRITTAGTLTTLVDFTGNGAVNRGTYPSATLLLGAGGNLYGTTGFGGTNDRGTVFRITQAGLLTSLLELSYDGLATRGAQPYATLTLASDGNFYGTTAGGGLNLIGTIFRVTPDGVMTTLVEFTGDGTSNRGANPNSFLSILGGNFYGATTAGGASNNGTLFQMTPGGALTTLVEFTGITGANRGATPSSSLTLGGDGNFYGTTLIGGSNNLGSVFRLTPGGTLTTLVDFTGNGANNRGSVPYASLVLGNDGNLYGTTSQGGATGVGTIFRMTTGGALTTLVEFTENGASNRGAFPYAGLARDSGGNFYGTTLLGGANDQGTVFRMTTAGALTTLVDFSGNGPVNKGADLYAGLVKDSDGNFYGTTRFGGASNAGTAFVVTPGGTLTTLVEFTGAGPQANSGGFPAFGYLTFGPDGKLYGTTVFGGPGGAGSVFRLDLGLRSQVRLFALTVNGPKIGAQGVAGHTYFIQATNDLTTTWSTISGPLVAAPDGMFQYLDPIAPLPPRRFYRVLTSP